MRQTVASHGNAIINRWKKKRPEQRRAILLQAFPKINDKQWILIHAKYDVSGLQELRHLREGLLLPYINLEVLSKDPFKFFALLHARSEFDPEEWVTFDKIQMNMGWYKGGLQVDYSNCAVVLHGARYGEVVPWNADKAHRWDICAFPKARLILEAQSTIMSFLRKTVENLLDGVNPSGEGAATKWIELAHSGFRRCIGAEAWSAFSNQAYSNPTFDFDRLLNIAQSRLSEANDHLWLLQTDAVYFQYHIKLCSQGQIFNAKHAKYRFLPPRMWTYPNRAAQSWAWIWEELEHAKAKYEKYHDGVKLGQPLPSELDFAMGCLELFLVNQVQMQREVLQETLPQLVTFQHHFTFDHSVSGRILVTTGSGPARGHDCKGLFKKDPLFWCLHMLFSHNFEIDDLANPSMLFGFLDNWMELETTSFKDKQRLEPRLLDELSAFAANHELLAAVRRFRPTFTNIDAMTAKQKCSDRASWRAMHKVAEDETYMRTSQDEVNEAFKLFEAAPFPTGKRDAEWLRRAYEVRQLSENFWAAARAVQKKHLAATSYARCTEADKKWFLSLLSFASTPEHQAFLKAEREAILTPKTTTTPVDLQPTPLAGWPNNASSNSSGTISSTRPKEKIKSRPDGITTVTFLPEVSDSRAANKPLSTPTVFVKNESIRVLSRMFPSTTEEYSAKPLDWKSFVVAMEDAGLFASQSGGSAVTFAKQGMGRIVFHRPHPIAKVDQTMLQCWGKRMRKWFGWERESFVDAKNALSS